VEMTEAMIGEWCEIGAAEISENLHSAGVQSATAIQDSIAQNLPALHRLADHIYAKWVQGLV
jgi:hypothetical protein